MKNDKATFEALLKLHKEDPTVLISNGFLERVRDNTALLAILDDEQQAFFDRSLEQSERDTELAIAAAEEGNTALIQAEERAQELEVAKHESDVLRIQAEESKNKAESLAYELERDRDGLLQELESTAQYQMESDRQRRQFVTNQANAYPAWTILGLLVIGVFILYWFEKPGVETLVPVLAAILGMMSGAWEKGYSSLFSTTIRDNKPAERNGRASSSEAKPK